MFNFQIVYWVYPTCPRVTGWLFAHQCKYPSRVITHVLVWLLLVATTSGKVRLYFQHSDTELFSVGYFRSDSVLPRQIGTIKQNDRTAPVTAP